MTGMITDLVRNKSTDITSTLDANKSAIEEAMKTVVEKYNDL